MPFKRRARSSHAVASLCIRDNFMRALVSCIASAWMAVATVACIGNADAAPRYVATRLATSERYLTATAISAQGAITGYMQSADQWRAFLYANGTVTDLGTMGADRSIGNGINALNEVVGYTLDPNSSGERAFVHSNGMMRPLDPLTTEPTIAYAINDRGYAVGSKGSRAVFFKDGIAVDLGVPEFSIAKDVNANGVICGTIFGNPWGTHAFLYASGSVTHLPAVDPIGSETTSFASAINRNGVVAGYGWSSLDNRFHAVVFVEGGVRDLGTLGGYSFANALNDAGLVVGESDLVPSGRSAFLYDGTAIYDLNQLVVSGLEGFTLRSAVGINNQGQIAAYAWDLEHSRVASFRLDPLPDPAAVPTLSRWSLTLTIAITMLAAAPVFHRRRRPIAPAVTQ